jgi:hypothetical protein
MKFDRKQFYQFCRHLKIESKEQGMITLGDTLLGTQTYVIDEVTKALEDDVHFFVVLKGRQLGITTISLAIDLYWHFLNPGMQGTLTTDTEENREQFRSTLQMYMDGLPKQYKIPLMSHNRNQMVLKNRSRMFYMWTTAKRARTQRAIFCGWWRNQLYSIDPNSDVYRVYWDGKLSAEEKEWTREIKKVYNYEINSRQMAWWRWKLHEGLKDEGLMYQEFPPTEDYAFVMTGSSFFSTARCTDAMKEAKLVDANYYRFSMGANFQDTELLKSSARLATLTIWEEPVSTAYYVIGADPAYGSSDWADRFCIQVFRCYADGLDQVAEFCTSELNTFQFAWVIAYLAGAYRNSTLNLEVNGPGQAVINELKNLKRQASAMPEREGRAMFDVLGNMQHYLWRRNDSMGGMSNKSC